MSKSKPLNEQMRAPKAAPANVPVMNPTGATGLEDLPDDVVALSVWRTFTGPQPMTIMVTKASWEMNKAALMKQGHRFHADRIYEFDSPTSPKGRRTTFHLQDVIGWAANVHSSIIQAPAGLKV